MSLTRDFRKTLAEGTLAALAQGTYPTTSGQLVSIAEAQRAAEAGSRLYRPGDAAELLGEFNQAPGAPAEIRVYQGTTLAAAEALAGRFERVGCLNFASARNPGGGFLGGSQAQEESLARSSGLYPCLTQFQEMYAHNARPGSTGLYSDYFVYSPGVPVLRGDDGEWLATPYALDVLTAPAVNAGALSRNAPHLLPELLPTMQHRLRLVLAAAARHRIDALILGAWGCGVFANDPAQVADIFAMALQEPAVRGRFARIDFAVYDPIMPHATLRAFERALSRI